MALTLLQAHGIASFRVCQITHPLENSPYDINVAIEIILSLGQLVFCEIRVQVTDAEFIRLVVIDFLLHSIDCDYTADSISKSEGLWLAVE